jgi:HTH-type transcriptional regulator / antitoxin HigA
MSEISDNDINQLLKRAFENNKAKSLQVIFDKKLEEYGITKTKVCTILNIDKDTLNDLITGTAKQPNLINVLKLSEFLEIDLKEIVSTILSNQTPENIGAIEKAKKASFIAKNFDLKKLTKLGFFTDTENIDVVTDRILSFFGYENVFDYKSSLMYPLFSKTKRTFTDKMKDFWVKSAYQCFRVMSNPNDYNREALKDILVKIKPYSQDVEKGLLTVCKALYNVGVTVIVQTQLPTTQVRGGTFIVNGKPCIVLTDLNKKYTTIWLTLIHEIHHVLYDLKTIENTTFHLTGDPDLFLIEEKADDFAIEYFCGLDRFRYITPHIHNEYLVSKFAKEIEVHPSFIYTSFQHFQNSLNNQTFYGAFKQYFPDYYLAIQNLNPVTWKENSISEIATNLKSIFELNEK